MSTTVVIRPRPLQGRVTPPPSKSMAHRCLIAAALAEGESQISNLADSQDITATKRCLAALKAEGDDLPLLDCGESGSTLRFLIPVALALRGGGRFTGHGRLMERPQQPYFDLFAEKNIFFAQENAVLTVKGQLTPGEYRLPGNVSSQFITGLLYALPLLEGDSQITLTTTLESSGYVDMTLEALEQFGVEVEQRGGGEYFIPGGQRYRPKAVTIEADWSQAAFWYAANFAGSHIQLEGLNFRSHQGDRVIAGQYQRLLQPGYVELDVSPCPDLVPPLAAIAALRRGGTSLVNAGRLRLKESDRLSTITQALNAMGARVEEHPDSLEIFGQQSLPGGGTVNCRNDHRIAMMAAAAAIRCEKPVTLLGAECVAKSYPEFWEVYQGLGGDLDVHISGS
jgi:3-phosphoshikimate 1-carboxyvinyltransferase